jgi:hypothetical protein
MRRTVLALAIAALLTLLGAACAREAAPAAAATKTAAAADSPQARIEADVRALADDAMQGREAGTAGYDKAADYVAGRMRAIGLQPAGDGESFFQTVPLLQARREQAGARLAIVHPDRTVARRAERLEELLKGVVQAA